MYTWNNVDLYNYGIVVENFPNLPKAERNTQNTQQLGKMALYHLMKRLINQ